MFLLVVLISVSAFTSSAVSGLWRNDTALAKLHVDWEASTNHTQHPFVHEISDMYNHNKSNALVNNLMGLLYQRNGDQAVASEYFKVACDNSNYQIIPFIKNFAQAQNLVDARETINVLSVALQKDI